MIVRVELIEEALGMMPAKPEIHREHIASKAPDAKTLEEEVAESGIDAVEDSQTTIFPKENGVPFWWNYQIKGSFKDACGMLARVPGTKSKELKAWRKVIDGIIFIYPGKILIQLPKDAVIGKCERPLRASTPKGERVCLAASETIPAGSIFEFQVECLNTAHEPIVREWLDYTARRGYGQWRNSGKGIAHWREIKE